MISSPLPRDVLLDTGLVVAAINVGSLNSASGRGFADQLVAERTRVHFSQILRLELTEALRKFATIPRRVADTVRRDFQLDHWERSVFVRRRWMRFGVQEFDALLARFDEVNELPFDQSIWLQSITVMTDERLRSHDAIHVATAREYRVPCIATTDDHFLRVNDLDVRLLRDTPSAQN